LQKVPFLWGFESKKSRAVSCGVVVVVAKNIIYCTIQ
jgi:hypothetical protein